MACGCSRGVEGADPEDENEARSEEAGDPDDIDENEACGRLRNAR